MDILIDNGDGPKCGECPLHPILCSGQCANHNEDDVMKEKRGTTIESTGCFECVFYESRCACRCSDGPDWESVYKAWRNGGFAIGCPLKQMQCAHSKGMTEHCIPCGRVHSAG